MRSGSKNINPDKRFSIIPCTSTNFSVCKIELVFTVELFELLRSMLPFCTIQGGIAIRQRVTRGYCESTVRTKDLHIYHQVE